MLTKSVKASNSLDKKFNLELNALLNNDNVDEKEMAADSKFGANSLESRVGSILARDDGRNDTLGCTLPEERLLSQPVNTLENADHSVEIPDYSPDFNSESEKISNMLQEEKNSDKNAR